MKPTSGRATNEQTQAARLVERLLEVGEKIGGNELLFLNDCAVGDLLKSDPFAFMLAASIDRGMVAEMAWRLPGKLKSVLGHLDPARMALMAPDQMLEVLKSIDGRPRYLGDAARTLIEVARYVLENCGGNARKLWQKQPATTIKRELRGIYGIGPGIASMVVLLLHKMKEISLGPADLAGTDLKPDVNVRRLFQRLGFCMPDPSERDVLEAARRLNPSYPGQLDGPAWYIGRTWCHAQEPACASCPLADVCPRLT